MRSAKYAYRNSTRKPTEHEQRILDSFKYAAEIAKEQRCVNCGGAVIRSGSEYICTSCSNRQGEQR